MLQLTPRLKRQLEKKSSLEKLLTLTDNIQGRTICALGDAAAMPVRAFIKTFKDEFIHHVENKCCLVDDPQ